MKIGTYYAYWEKEWDGVDFFPYIGKVKELGFDVLEISGGSLEQLSDEDAQSLGKAAKDAGITLTACIGLPEQYDVSSEKEEVRQAGIQYVKKILNKMKLAGISQLGGITYAYWPYNYDKPVNKEKTREISIGSVRDIADYAMSLGIRLTLEVVNRYEHFLMNTSKEAVEFVRDVDRENVYVMLDAYHMNIEEDSFREAILTAGKKLGHFHIGEANRKVPGSGRLPWQEMADALHEIGYEGTVVMEPFVRPGGTVGSDIKVWRDLSDHADEKKLDDDIRRSCAFCQKLFNSVGA